VPLATRCASVSRRWAIVVSVEFMLVRRRGLGLVLKTGLRTPVSHYERTRITLVKRA
jgi:hypothetical protein